MQWVLLGILAAIVGAVGGSVEAASVSLVPVKDNTIIQWSPDGPPPNPYRSNGQGDIFVGRTNQDGQEEATISIRRGLVKFDVAAAVPAGSQITGVSLALRDVRSLNGDPTVSLHRVLADWGEGASYFDGGQGTAALDGDVTWLHTFYDADNPEASETWDTPGGDFVAVSSAETVVDDDFEVGHIFAWSGAGMIADVQAWLDDPAGNFGWLIKGDESRGQSAKRFDGRIAETPDDVPPALVIEFEPAFAGDYNDDGMVDAADYTVWRNHLGQAIRLPNETATPNVVNAADYAEWKANYGNIESGAGGVAIVPEPDAVVLGLGAILAVGIVRVGFVTFGKDRTLARAG